MSAGTFPPVVALGAIKTPLTYGDADQLAREACPYDGFDLTVDRVRAALMAVDCASRTQAIEDYRAGLYPDLQAASELVCIGCDDAISHHVETDDENGGCCNVEGCGCTAPPLPKFFTHPARPALAALLRVQYAAQGAGVPAQCHGCKRTSAQDCAADCWMSAAIKDVRR